jgi:hypothetical protein
MDRLDHLLREYSRDLTELGIQAEYLDAADGRPLASVAVQAPPHADGSPRAITLAFLPGDELEEVDLLQLFTPLPVAPDATGEATGARLMAVNRHAVLGHCGVTDEGQIYWRHIWPIPRGLPIVPSVLFEVLTFFVFSAELALEEWAAG